MQNQVIAVFGRKGCGKSTLVKEIVDESPRVIIFDTMGEYNGRRDKPIEDFRQAAMALVKAQHDRSFRLVIRLEDEQDALDAMRIAFDVGNFLLVVEETSFYCSPSYLPPELAKFVRYGRHRGIDQIYISRRPAEIHRDLTAQADLIVSFQQREPKDVEYLRRSMGSEIADRLPHLPKYAILVSGEVEDAPLPVLGRLTGKKVRRGKKKRPRLVKFSRSEREEENSLDTRDPEEV